MPDALTAERARPGRLTGKIAFISGIAGGQGRAAALLFTQEGATVWGCDVNVEGAAETVAMVRAAGGDIDSLHPLDLMTADGPTRWVAEGVERHRRIDVLYNNASLSVMRTLSDPDAWEAWRTTIAGELDLVFATILAAWPHLTTQEGGASIINTASTAARRGQPLPITSPGSSAAHSAAKAGVIGLTRQVAAEGAPFGIRANAILPGFIEAPVTAPVLARPGVRESIAKLMPLNRIGQPDDVAKVAAFLASDDSAWMNAEEVTVDGGAIGIARYG